VKRSGTIVLPRRDVVELLPMDECIEAVERAFRLHAEGCAIAPGVLGTHVDRGGFHVKTAGLPGRDRSYFAAKVNANFPDNRERFGIPTIQGVIALFDVEDGYPLALLDSAEITTARTAAATAVAARYLACHDSTIVTVGAARSGYSVSKVSPQAFENPASVPAGGSSFVRITPETVTGRMIE
jgi:alanine dehydrogenase